MITLGNSDGRWRVCAWRGGFSWFIGDDMWCFRPPWNRPLFSERNGCHRMVFKVAGWRLFVRNIGARPVEAAQ